jgi:hypothetical protein
MGKVRLGGLVAQWLARLLWVGTGEPGKQSQAPKGDQELVNRSRPRCLFLTFSFRDLARAIKALNNTPDSRDFQDSRCHRPSLLQQQQSPWEVSLWSQAKQISGFCPAEPLFFTIQSTHPITPRQSMTTTTVSAISQKTPPCRLQRSMILAPLRSPRLELSAASFEICWCAPSPSRGQHPSSLHSINPISVISRGK